MKYTPCFSKILNMALAEVLNNFLGLKMPILMKQLKLQLVDLVGVLTVS